MPRLLFTKEHSRLTFKNKQALWSRPWNNEFRERRGTFADTQNRKYARLNSGGRHLESAGGFVRATLFGGHINTMPGWRPASLKPEWTMRNLVQYPITSDEIVACLRQLSTEISDIDGERLIGDMRPLLLQTAANVVEAADEMLKGIDKRLATPNIPYPRTHGKRQREGGHPDPLKWVTPWKEATALIEAFESGNPKVEVTQ